jgi:hypothetical protein
VQNGVIQADYGAGLFRGQSAAQSKNALAKIPAPPARVGLIHAYFQLWFDGVALLIA